MSSAAVATERTHTRLGGALAGWCVYVLGVAMAAAAAAGLLLLAVVMLAASLKRANRQPPAAQVRQHARMGQRRR